jgi:hypothetical protein
MKEKLLRALRIITYINGIAVLVQTLIIVYRAPPILPWWLQLIWYVEMVGVVVCAVWLHRSFKKDLTGEIAQIKREVADYQHDVTWAASIIDSNQPISQADAEKAKRVFQSVLANVTSDLNRRVVKPTE